MPTPDSIEFAAYNLRANRSPPLIFSGIYVVYLTVSGRSSSRGGRNLNFSPVWLHNLSIGCCQPLCGLSDCLGSGPIPPDFPWWKLCNDQLIIVKKSNQISSRNPTQFLFGLRPTSGFCHIKSQKFGRISGWHTG